ncbi:hypothetical protein U9M48_029216 [Paspalum notatum var. saurae]|uniref:Uncharacterized protein n=1 Tax=Paspalum notatum var. saurae TaxID=547442 RepID=A0AAQ3TY04_PASNO
MEIIEAPPLPTARTVARLGLLTSAYAVHSLAGFLQVKQEVLDTGHQDFSVLLLQASAAALCLLLAGRGRLALAFVALAACAFSLVALAVLLAGYCCCCCCCLLRKVVLVGGSIIAVGIVTAMVPHGLVAVLRAGQQ